MHPEKGFDATIIDELDRLNAQVLTEARNGEDTTQTRIKIESLLRQPVDSKHRPQFPNPAERRAQRSALMTAIVAGTVLNVLSLIGLGLFFLGSIVERLRVVLDNTVRLSSGKRMHAPLPGSDELADVDHQFHKMSITLKESEHRQSMLLNNARDVICSVDEKMKFRAVSNASATIFGVDSEKLVGQSMLQILPQESLQRMRVALAPGGTDQEFEMEVRRPDGELLETLWSARWSPEDRLSVCVVHDNTERKAAERLRKEILEMVSHDLRSPLATIGGFHSLLQTGQLGHLNDQGIRFLTLSIDNTNRMLALVNDLLDAEMIQSGMLQIQMSPTDADGVLHRSTETTKVQASSKSITIQAVPCGLKVNGDTYRLEQILVNLLTNAIKFSPDGSTIRVGAERKGNVASFYVSDQGRGIPKEAQATIFDRFTQAERGDAKRGSGLGLWICKSLVELHGGTITLESEPGRGTTFRFTIPLASS
jgi:PAS domain S-box-containing protein